MDGMTPAEIPIVANNQRDIWINNENLIAANVSLPDRLTRKRNKVARLEAKP